MTFLRTALRLCSGFRPYQEIRDVPFFSSVKYLLKLMTVLALALVLTMIPALLAAIDQFADLADQHLPPMTIEDGRVSTAVDQPYTAGTPAFRIIVDTTGTVTNADPTAQQGLLINADNYLVWVCDTNAVDAVQQRRATFQGFPDGTIDGDYLRRLVRWILPVGLPLAFVAMILIGMLIALIQAYLFSFIGSVLGPSGGPNLQMNQLLNIAIHAVTPGAVIVTAYLMMQLEGLNLWLVYLVAYGIFLVGATHACRNDDLSPPPVLPET